MRKSKNQQDAEYYVANRDKIRVQQAAHYAANAEERIEQQTTYYQTHKAEHLAYARRSQRKLRADVLQHYGNKCACCGEEAEQFLTLDHVDGGGNEHRRSLRGNLGVYRWVRQNGYPEGFQVLCYNCNCARGAYGYCHP